MCGREDNVWQREQATAGVSSSGERGRVGEEDAQGGEDATAETFPFYNVDAEDEEEDSDAEDGTEGEESEEEDDGDAEDEEAGEEDEPENARARAARVTRVR